MAKSPEPDTPFHVATTSDAGRRVVMPRGELDIATAGELEVVLAQAVAGADDTVLDLGQLTFADSSGIKVLVDAARRARAQGRPLEVRDPQPAVFRVLELTGLLEELGLDDSGGGR